MSLRDPWPATTIGTDLEPSRYADRARSPRCRRAVGLCRQVVGSGDLLVERGVGGLPQIALAPKPIFEFSALKDAGKPSVGGCPIWMEFRTACLRHSIRREARTNPGREDCSDHDLAGQLKTRTSGGKRRGQQERHLHAFEDSAVRLQVFAFVAIIGSVPAFASGTIVTLIGQRLVARRDRVAGRSSADRAWRPRRLFAIGRGKCSRPCRRTQLASFCSISI